MNPHIRHQCTPLTRLLTSEVQRYWREHIQISDTSAVLSCLIPPQSCLSQTHTHTQPGIHTGRLMNFAPETWYCCVHKSMKKSRLIAHWGGKLTNPLKKESLQGSVGTHNCLKFERWLTNSYTHWMYCITVFKKMIGASHLWLLILV